MKKKGLKLQGGFTNLTPLEKEILSYLTKDFMTVEQIALKRQCSLNAIYKVRKRLLNKGLINSINISNSPQETQVEFRGGPSKPSEKIRLHAEHFSISVLWSDARYDRKVTSSNSQFVLDDNTVICYCDKIEVYSNKDFWGSDPNAAKVKSLAYWARFFVRLESSVNCVLVKNGSQNINLIRAEYAEVGNELAHKALVENEKVRVVGEDGKVWLLIDNSFKFEELETVHRSRSKDDMQDVVQPFFNDLRDKPSMLPSKVDSTLLTSQKQIFEIASGLNVLTKTINSLLVLYTKAQETETKDPIIDDANADYFG